MPNSDSLRHTLYGVKYNAIEIAMKRNNKPGLVVMYPFCGLNATKTNDMQSRDIKAERKPAHPVYKNGSDVFVAISQG